MALMFQFVSGEAGATFYPKVRLSKGTELLRRPTIAATRAEDSGSVEIPEGQRDTLQ